MEAQVKWITNNLDQKFQRVATPPLSYEALFEEHSGKGAWQAAFRMGKGWVRDEPFSIRALSSMTFLCGEFLRDYESSIFCSEKMGKMLPKEPGLRMGLAPSLAYLGRLDEAEIEIQRNLREVDEGSQQPILRFNRLMISQFQNKNEDYTLKILELIKESKGASNNTFRARAALHWIRVLMHLKRYVPKEHVEAITKPIIKNNFSKEVKQLCDQIMKEHKFYNAGDEQVKLSPRDWLEQLDVHEA